MLNQFFDHIYVLTLERAHHRRNHIESELKGLSFEFFTGVDKHQLDRDTLIDKGVYDDQRHRSCKRTHRGMNLGEIACALSHRNIWQDAVDKGYESILILEDDIHLERSRLASFGRALEELPNQWELLMLGYYSEKYPSFKTHFQRATYQLYHQLKWFNWHKVSKGFIDNLLMQPFSDHLYRIGKLVGGHAYALRLETCRKFVAYQTPVFLQADRIYNYYLSDQGLNAFALKDKLFTLAETANDSMIGYASFGEKLIERPMEWCRKVPSVVQRKSSKV
ncbi:glycosyltransferase family 25 protein [Acanthopleuribacter pedis]|uniref:Glycosyltransferase family 25 protein n=1 Tax=Acanthopleuribacter pedis TaxID=442870 RepID=A0A8J7QDP0_9BACT|nr:glycosyltransferase family 25 protein [Acanthopleuribacter pedis]MBO1317705.1 glycosyltransferase family 25 protein [Acanthopleuribacter pedis]